MKRIENVPNESGNRKATSRANHIAHKTCAFRLNWLPLEHESLYDPDYADLKPSECGYIEKSTSKTRR